MSSETRTSIHGQWSSRMMFIMAATGSAVGLGNIWKFPYITGENGGGAFVLVYLLCIAAIGVPIMMSEIMLGRRGRQSPINTMKTLAFEAGRPKVWSLLGWFGVIASILAAGGILLNMINPNLTMASFLILIPYEIVLGFWLLIWGGQIGQL